MPATLVGRLTAKLVDRLTAKLVDRLTAKLVNRLTATLVNHLTAKFMNRLTAKPVDRLTAKLVVANLVKLDLTKSNRIIENSLQHYIYTRLKKERYFWLITSGLMVSGRFVSTWKWPIVPVLVNEPGNVNSVAY